MKTNIRNHTVAIALTADEHAFIKKLTAKSELSVGQVLRVCAMADVLRMDDPGKVLPDRAANAKKIMDAFQGKVSPTKHKT